MSASPPILDLQTLRQAIDGIDEALAGLLACRVCLSRHAQALKARAGLPAYDRERETEIRSRYERRWRGASVVAGAILEFCRES